MNGFCADVLEFDNMVNKDHSAMKPVPLMERLVGLSSAEGQVVLDVFAGSASTLVAAKGLGRNVLGCEREYNHYVLAKQRLLGVDE